MINGNNIEPAWGQIMTQPIREKVDPENDLKDFVKRAESGRQEAVNATEKNKQNKPPLLDLSIPVKNEAILGGSGDKKKKLKNGTTDEPEGPTVNHQWQISSEPVEGNATPKWKAAKGDIYPNGQGIKIVVPETIVEGALGTIYLKIPRDATTRVISAPEMLIAAVMPDDTNTHQHISLGEVGGDPEIIQHQFKPIRLLEMLIVANGTFKLGNFAMMGNNLYDTP